MHRGKTFHAHLMASAAVVSLMAAPAAAHAAEREFNIAPQSLETALADFSSQSMLPVLTTPEITGAKQTGGVVGSAEPATALAQLLQGTGLTYRRQGDTFLIIRADQDPQGGSAAGGSSTVEALIVTAQKREEDIQDVPIAISAFSQEDLTRSQVAGGPDLMTQVPNMTFTKTNFSSYSIQIRGIGTQAISATTDPAVAVALNNTPFVRNRFFEQEFYDLQRVEVLRGPQGTLYGRNATAGVVNIITQKPKFFYEARLSGDVANYNSTRLEGMVNVPLVEDVVAFRLAGAWTKREGYSTNEITGTPIDGRDLWSTRASLRFAPNDRLDVNLIWEHFEEDDDRLRSGKQLCKKHTVTELRSADGSRVVDVSDNPRRAVPDYGQQGGVVSTVQSVFSQGCIPNSLYDKDSFQTPNGQSIPYYFQLGAIGLPRALDDPYVSEVQSRDLRVIESTVDPDYRAETDIVELQATFDLTDTLSLTSETSWGSDFVWSMQDFNRFNTASGAWAITNQNNPSVTRGILTPGPNGHLEFCDPQIGCADRLVALDLSTETSTQFSQELRLGSDFDGPFNFSLGANYLRHDAEAKYYVFINSLSMSAVIGQNGSGGDRTYVPGVTTNEECLRNGPVAPTLTQVYGLGCVYMDPNPISSLNDQGHNYFLSRNPYKLISYAVFGEIYYNVTENLKVTGGLRWTVDKKEAPRIPSWLLAGQTVGYPVQDVTEQEWREPTGRLTIDWKPDLAFTDETLIYGSIARGYKAGGANPPPFGVVMFAAGAAPEVADGFLARSATAPRTFDAEFINAFEVGSKNTFSDGRVTLNLAAFYYDYKDYQISQIVNRSALNLNFDAEVWGLEIEADWRPLENLRLGFKGGYENTRIADGERAIDIMDRTAGREGWSVVRPFPTFPSNCILPTELYLPAGGGIGGSDILGLGGPNGGNPGGCEIAYVLGLDPGTELPFGEWDGTGPGAEGAVSFWGDPSQYPEFDPSQPDINNGEGFFKDLSGNELPNAPNFTATITADYTVPLAADWLMTLHTDLYYQSEAWTRIFNTEGYDKLKAYTNVNLAAIFTNEEAGWKVMAYVKNVMDRDSITGAFLNSDDTGLTTNVFLTEPRLYGIRVTKDWTGGPLLGSFGARGSGPHPFTIELGGQVQRHDAPSEMLRPAVLDNFSDALQPTVQNRDLDWGDGRSIKLTYSPAGPWTVAAGVRFGRTNRDIARERREQLGDVDICAYLPSDSVVFYGQVFDKYASCDPESDSFNPGYALATETNWSYSEGRAREEHMVVDFEVGRDFGFGGLDRSMLRAGLRYAEFKSESSLTFDGIPDWEIPSGWRSAFITNRPANPASFHRYDASVFAEREFDGGGPVLAWDAAKTLLGGDDTGRLMADWSVGGGVLFGKQKTMIVGEERSGYWTGNYPGPNAGKVVTPTGSAVIDFQRSDDVTAPFADLSLGLSYSVDGFKVGAGYRWERYFDVLDVGYDEARDGDRTIDGPYFKLSVGFGGG